jgi:hypothetical protein
MFGFRSDGKRIKTIDPLMKLVPHIMPERNDAMVMSVYDIDCAGMDEYIFKRRKEGVRVNYMDITIAAMARVMAERPRLNRFISNGRIYRRNLIQLSFTIKKALKDGADETVVKLTFKGTETLDEVKAMLDKEVVKNSSISAVNEADKLAKLFTIVPNFMIKFLVGTLRLLDKLGLLPKSILEVSPFHTSLYLTNMKSIKMNYVLHHIYNFGTTSMFISMGKEKHVPVVVDPDEATFGVQKLIQLGCTIDERICDGLYFGNSMKAFKTYMGNPALLETPLEAKIEDMK